jgi:hypothetical protein
MKNNQKYSVVTFLILLSLLISNISYAALPRYLSAQAKVTDKEGVELDGDYSVTFRIYSSSSGGTELWEETQTLSISDGIFDAVLGLSTAFPSTMTFNTDYWVSIEVESDGEMSPRLRLTSAAYALNADEIDDIDSTQIVRNDTDNTISGNLTVTGNVTVGNASSDSFTIYAATISLVNASNLDLVNLSTTALNIESGLLNFDTMNSRVGVGTTAPESKLQVLGGDLYVGTGTFSNSSSNPDAYIQGNLEVDGTIYADIAGSISTAGTTNLTFTVDNDNTSGTEPADGAGYIIEGGSGDANILWDATNDELDVNKKTNFSGNVITSGNIGIGTTSPVDPLHIVADTGHDNIDLEENSGGESWQIGVNAAGDLNFEDGGTSRVTFEDDGNVGIGTTNPSAALQIGSATGTLADGAGDAIISADLEVDDQVRIDGVNVAGSGKNILTLTGTLDKMDGSDTVRGIYIDYTNSEHSGASNFFYGIDIDSITGHAGATETALNIGSGWDYQIALRDASNNYYTTFTAGDHMAGDRVDINYTLPISAPANNGDVLSSTTAGVLSWASDATGAPTDATYVTLSNNAILSAERALTEGAAIDVTDDGANSTVRVAFDSTEVGTTTWGSGSGITWTFNVGTTDPAIAFGDGRINIDSNTLYVDVSSDEVGIGNTSPSAALDVGGGTAILADGAGDAIIAADLEVDDQVRIDGVNVAGSGKNILLLGGTLGVFDGSDVFRGIFLKYTNANHTGSSNYVVGIDIETITGDAEAREGGLVVGTGWDEQISLLESSGAAYYTGFKAGDQSADITYTLPTAAPASDGKLLSSTTAGVMSWASDATGAPTDATYVTLSNVAVLSAERVLTEGTAIDVTDDGAKSTVTVAFDSTELGTTTWGSGSGITWTFDTGTIDPGIVFGDGRINIDSNTLYVDVSSNEVGIGNTSPSAALDVGGGTATLADGAGDAIISADLEVDDQVQIDGVNAVGSGKNILTLSGTLKEFNGNDVFNGIYINYTNANHVNLLGQNYFFGLHIDSITADADAIEAAIYVEGGWDAQISLQESNGSTYTAFITGDQSAVITYTLPTAAPTSDRQALTATTAGVMSWSDSMGSFTIAGDSGSDTIADSNTLTLAGGANGIDTVGGISADTVTFNFDSTEVGTTTWGAGSGNIVWTFNTGNLTDPAVTLTSTEMGINCNLGIGTTDPGYALDVNGTANFVTSIQIPAAANPTIDTEGEIAYDSDDENIRVYDGSANRAINTVQTITKAIFDPDGIQATEDAVPILAVESDWAPFGITLLSVGIKTDAASTYSVNFEEWTSPTDATPSTIEAVATSTSTEAEDDGTLSDSSIATGSIVYADLPTTGIDMLTVWCTYYINSGD